MYLPPNNFTVEHAGAALTAGLAAIKAGQAEFDLGGLTAVDSSTVATLVAWARAAAASGAKIVFRHPPENLQSLAQLYGISELLNLPVLAAERHPGSTPA
jgi:phospholipid transport system transporter-binding protein